MSELPIVMMKALKYRLEFQSELLWLI